MIAGDSVPIVASDAFDAGEVNQLRNAHHKRPP